MNDTIPKQEDKKRSYLVIILLFIIVGMMIGFVVYSNIQRSRIHELESVTVPGPQARAIDSANPAGTYISYGNGSGSKTVILQIHADVKHTVVLTQDANTGQKAVTTTGTWQIAPDEELLVSLKDGDTLKFDFQFEFLVLVDFDHATWGDDGLKLGASPIALDSDWSWTSTSLPGGIVRTPNPGTSYVLTLGASGVATVLGDCNTLSGPYHLYAANDASINLSSATKKFCPNTQDSQFTSDIDRTTAYHVDGDTLTLSLEGDTQGYGTMTFVRMRPKTDTSTSGQIGNGTTTSGAGTSGTDTGGQTQQGGGNGQSSQDSSKTTYHLVSYNGKAVDSDKYLLSLGSDGTLGAHFCNSMGGTYYYDRNGLLVSSDLIGTQMACSEPANLMEIESTFGAMLSKGAGVQKSQDGATLTLTNNRGTAYIFSSL